MKITLERLRYKGSFNQQGYEELPNGNIINTNEKLFDFWFGYYKQSLSQSVSSNAFDYLKDKVTIVARHNDYFVTAMSDTSYTITLPKPNDKIYNVASINPDYEINGYDTIVLSAVGGTSDTTSNTDTSSSD
ncbi:MULTISPECIES: hypothetical protein [Lactobacillaceae]|uniref:hypothetical protein n=1 Tax=Lactobacillaceae TaxID=33958 RepID=UPI00128C932A|nr:MULTISPECIES: hypothetical protein [Lactobacillaceae]MCT3234143.1 hypothetical protein [Lactiplantibacillus plantarum]MQC05574.1 hypothetical protein [Limosilactobacillus reuteri]